MLALNIRFAYFGSLANWLVCIFGVSVHRKTSGCHPICYDIFFFFFDNPDNCDLSLNSFFLFHGTTVTACSCRNVYECIVKCRRIAANHQKVVSNEVMKRKRGHSDKRCVHFSSSWNLVDFSRMSKPRPYYLCLPFKRFSIFMVVCNSTFGTIDSKEKMSKIWLEKWFYCARISHI